MAKYRVLVSAYAHRALDVDKVKEHVEQRASLMAFNPKIVSFEPRWITPGYNRRYDIEFKIVAANKSTSKRIALQLVDQPIFDQAYIRTVEKIPRIVHINLSSHFKSPSSSVLFETEYTTGTDTTRRSWVVEMHGLLDTFQWNNEEELRMALDAELLRLGLDDVITYDLCNEEGGWRQWTIWAVVYSDFQESAAQLACETFDIDSLWKEFKLVKSYLKYDPLKEESMKLYLTAQTRLTEEDLKHEIFKMRNDCRYVQDVHIRNLRVYAAGAWVSVLVKYDNMAWTIAYDNVARVLNNHPGVIRWELSRNPDPVSVTKAEENVSLAQRLSSHEIGMAIKEVVELPGFAADEMEYGALVCLVEWLSSPTIVNTTMYADALKTALLELQPLCNGDVFTNPHGLEITIINEPQTEANKKVVAKVDSGNLEYETTFFEGADFEQWCEFIGAVRKQ